jgi:hypothetical protein
MASSGSSSNSGSRSGPLSFLANLYDLDTLDTRFTTPSSVPYRVANDKREDDKVVVDQRTEPPKWRSFEFHLYYLVIAAVVPYMFWVAYDVSRRRSSFTRQHGKRLGEGLTRGQRRIRGTTGSRTGSRTGGFQGARS